MPSSSETVTEPGVRPHAYDVAQTAACHPSRLIPSIQLPGSSGGALMLGAMVILLLLLWALGLMTAYTLGGFIHVLLVVALAGLAFLMQQGRRF
ncbi:hypothetical protein D3C85_1170770 [compost metagenome]